MYVEIWFMNRAVEKNGVKKSLKKEIRVIFHSDQQLLKYVSNSLPLDLKFCFWFRLLSISKIRRHNEV
jgi:hypothetical protein